MGKCLLHHLVDLSLDPQHPQRSRVWQCTSSTTSLQMQNQADPTGLLASQPSQIKELPVQ